MSCIESSYITIVAFCELAVFALNLKWFGFRSARLLVASVPVANVAGGEPALPSTILAVQRACIYFPASMMCLARGAVVTRMLRRRGFHASFVIGVRPVPFAAHAWVEHNGIPIYGEIDGLEYFHVIDRA